MALALCIRTVISTRMTPKFSPQSAFMHYRDLIGKREIVGFGWNGQPMYCDSTAFFFPSMRWREPTPEIEVLQKKEKGDWHKLTLKEKKSLYRYSYCQTYSEFTAPFGMWKSTIGAVCGLIGVALWYFYFQRLCIDDPLPHTFSEECRRAQFRRMLDIRAQHIFGVSSKWDYEKDDWKC